MIFLKISIFMWENGDRMDENSDTSWLEYLSRYLYSEYLKKCHMI